MPSFTKEEVGVRSVVPKALGSMPTTTKKNAKGEKNLYLENHKLCREHVKIQINGTAPPGHGVRAMSPPFHS